MQCSSYGDKTNQNLDLFGGVRMHMLVAAG